MLGSPAAQTIFDLVQSIGDGKVKEVLTRSSKMVAGGLSSDALLANLIEHLRNLLVLRTCGKDSELVEVPGIPIDELVAQAEKFDSVVLTQDIAILEELRRNLRSTQAGRARDGSDAGETGDGGAVYFGAGIDCGGEWWGSTSPPAEAAARQLKKTVK